MMFQWFIDWLSCSKAHTNEGGKVLDYIHKHGSIDVDDAKSIGVKHLRSVICTLKRNGYAIKNVNPLGQKAEYKFK